jgi:hypothetical protein
LAEVQQLSEDLFAQAKVAVGKCDFPDQPDKEKAEKLLMLLMPYDKLPEKQYLEKLWPVIEQGLRRRNGV